MIPTAVDAPNVAATPSAYIPHLDGWDCTLKLRDMAARACRGMTLSQADAEANVACDISIATYGSEDNRSILGVEQGQPDCERVLLYNWFGEQNSHGAGDAAALNATAARIRAQYAPPPAPTPNSSHLAPRASAPSPCTRTVTAPSGGISVPHPCR